MEGDVCDLQSLKAVLGTTQEGTHTGEKEECISLITHAEKLSRRRHLRRPSIRLGIRSGMHDTQCRTHHTHSDAHRHGQ